MFGIAGEEAAGQHLDSGFLPQVARKCQVVAIGNFQPNVERRVRQFDIECLLQNRNDAVEFFLVEAAVGNDVFFIVPSGNAGALDGNAHRAAVVGAVEQEVFEQLGIACDKAGTQTGDVGAFGQAGEHNNVACTTT